MKVSQKMIQLHVYNCLHCGLPFIHIHHVHHLQTLSISYTHSDNNPHTQSHTRQTLRILGIYNTIRLEIINRCTYKFL